METHKAAEQNWYCWLYHTAAAARDRQREEKIHFMYQSIASDLFSTHSAAHMHMMNINCHTSLFFHHIKLISKMSFSINIYFYVIAGERAFKAYKKGSFNALSIATKWQMFCEMMTMGKNIMNRKKKELDINLWLAEFCGVVREEIIIKLISLSIFSFSL